MVSGHFTHTDAGSLINFLVNEINFHLVQIEIAEALECRIPFFWALNILCNFIDLMFHLPICLSVKLIACLTA